MATHLYQAADTDEYWHDVDAEMLANLELNGVIGGCALTYSASAMTVTMGAGTILANGTVVQVAADGTGVTLSADSSNPRWAVIGLNTSGAMVLVSGTPATTPAKPELSSIQVVLAMVRVTAGLTIANDATVKLDKRIPIRSFIIRATANETAKNNNDTLVDHSKFKFYCNASEAWTVELVLGVTSNATADFKHAWTVPASGSAVGMTTTTAAAAILAWITDGTVATAVPISGTVEPVITNMTLVNSTTAGNFTFQWSQNTATVVDTYPMTGSIMRAYRAT